MNFLEDLKQKTLLITPNNLKEKVLEEISKLNKLINIKIMSKEEFSKHYFFDYTKETIYYIVKKYQITQKNAIIYLDNMKYALNTNLNVKNIQVLKDMYKDLKENNLLKFDPYFKDYLKSLDIIILNKEAFEPFYFDILKNYNLTYQTLKSNSNNNILLYHFKTIEEECAFVMNSISKLIKKGISINNIKLTNVKKEYIPFLKRMSYFYNLKINNLEKTSIFATVITNKLIKLIENREPNEKIFEFINHNLDKDISLLFLNILNQYYFVDNYYDVLDLIKDDLKKTNLKPLIYQDAIEVINLDSNILKEDDYVFLLGFNMENIPTTYKDIDYLNDNLKSKLGLFTSIQKNNLEKEVVIKNILSISNLIITYKDYDPYQSYYPSILIEELNLKEENMIETSNNTSNIYNKIKLVQELDTMIKYGTKFFDTNILLNTYQDIPYLTYNNKFTGIKDEKLDKIVLSYTSLNNYYHCAFRYYIDNILKLNIYEDTFKIYIGNLFHYILSKMFDANFDFNEEFLNYTKTKTFTKKEEFYLNILKEELLNIIEVIKYQHQLSGLTNLKLEESITLKYQDNYIFKGIIDKIMYKEKNGNTYLSLIDYKTGTPKTDMTNLIYGIDMQLPIYVYLVKKSNLFLNPKIIGFYLQQILHEKTSFDLKKDNNIRRRENLKLIGFSISDPYLVNMFDASYENSEMIKGMKVTSKGFSHYTKIISEDEIDNLINLVEEKIKNSLNEIANFNFPINPKVIGGENIGCSYCKYKDLCFMTGSDYIYLPKYDKMEYLNRGD